MSTDAGFGSAAAIITAMIYCKSIYAAAAITSSLLSLLLSPSLLSFLLLSLLSFPWLLCCCCCRRFQTQFLYEAMHPKELWRDPSNRIGWDMYTTPEESNSQPAPSQARSHSSRPHCRCSLFVCCYGFCCGLLFTVVVGCCCRYCCNYLRRCCCCCCGCYCCWSV